MRTTTLYSLCRVGRASSGAALALLVLSLAGACAGSTSSRQPGTGSGSAGSTGATGAAGTTGGAGTTGAAGATGAAGSGYYDGGSSDGSVTGTAGSFGTGAAGSTGAAGTTGSAGTGAAGAGSGGTNGCAVSIVPVSPASLSDAEAGATVRLQVSGYGLPAGADGGAPAWSWSVKKEMPGDGGVPILGAFDDHATVGDSGSTIDIQLTDAVSYQVQVSVAGAPACAARPLTFVAKQAQPSFRFRVTPPSSSQLPTKEISVAAAAITAGGAVSLDLGEARSSELVTLSPVDGRGFPTPTYVRITSPSFQFAVEGYTGKGALVTPLATDYSYDVLMIPDDTRIAPQLVSGPIAFVTNKMALVQGASVNGVARDGNGAPVAGARVLLINGEQPSTLGVSGADGTFALTTREGTFAAEVAAPPGAGLPDAHVAASSAITLLPGAKSLALALDWAKVPAAALTIAVTGAGAAPVAGAHVRVDLAAPIANAATLQIPAASGASVVATGTAHADALTDAAGVAQLGRLPTGTYHVIVAPPSGLTGAGLTLADVVLPAKGLAGVIALAAPLAVTGSLTPAAASAGATITALDRGMFAAPTVPTATAGSDGTYQLSLAAGRTYELLVDPAPASGLARSVVDRVTPSASAHSFASHVPTALAVTGNVTGAGHVVGGALVQVFCAAPASSCIDQKVPLAEGTTGPDGSVALRVPGSLASP